MALTADYDVREKAGEVIAYEVSANAVLYRGALVCRNAAGYAVAGADSAGYALLGVALEQADNTGGGSGAKTVRVRKRGTFVYSLSGAAQADVGKAVYVAADNIVSLTGTNAVLAGYIVAVEGADQVRVRIDNAVR